MFFFFSPTSVIFTALSRKLKPFLRKLKLFLQKGEALTKISSVVALQAWADIKKSESLSGTLKPFLAPDSGTKKSAQREGVYKNMYKIHCFCALPCYFLTFLSGLTSRAPFCRWRYKCLWIIDHSSCGPEGQILIDH